MNWVKIRWFLAACSVLLCVKLMVSALLMNSINAAWHVLGSVLLFVTSVLLVIPETAKRVAEWCARPFADILFPSEEFTRPPLNYQLARRYRDELRWEDAAIQYKKIIRYYPKEREAYVELLGVAEHLPDKKLRERYAEMLRKRFQQSEAEVAS
jgi:hypothetical protein